MSVEATNFSPVNVQSNESSFGEFMKIAKDDKLYAAGTLYSLAVLTIGIIASPNNLNGIKQGIGLFAICNLIKGNLTEDEKIAKTCLKMGSAAAILSFFIPTNQIITNDLKIFGIPMMSF
jgi:hypothetical protein